MLTRRQLQRIAQSNLQFSPGLLQAALERAAKDWERDLRPLLPQFVVFDDVRRTVESFMRED